MHHTCHHGNRGYLASYASGVQVPVVIVCESIQTTSLYGVFLISQILNLSRSNALIN